MFRSLDGSGRVPDDRMEFYKLFGKVKVQSVLNFVLGLQDDVTLWIKS